MKELLNKFEHAESISDKELDTLIAHYQTLVHHLEPHGAKFWLVLDRCSRDLDTLSSYKRNRKTK